MRVKCKIGVVLAVGLLLSGSAAAQTLAIDPAHSSFTVHVFKAGMFSAFGHAHEIRAPLSAGLIHEGEPASVEVEIDAHLLKVVDPDLSSKDRAEVQETMLGPKVLDNARFPRIRFRSTAVEKKGIDHWQVLGELMLHGQTKLVVVDVERHGDRYDGSANLLQTDFGITPIRIAGGTVKVRNEIQVEFDIALKK